MINFVNFLKNYSFIVAIFTSIFFSGLVFIALQKIIRLAGSIKIWVVQNKNEIQNFFFESVTWPSLLKKKTKRWDRWWRWSGAKFVPKVWFQVSVIIFLLLVFTLFFELSGFFGGLILVFIFYLLVVKQARDRQKLFLAELPDALRSLSDMLSVGLEHQTTVSLLAEESPAPVNIVFKAMERGAKLGISNANTLESLKSEINLNEWSVTAAVLARFGSQGGNILPALNALGQALRDNSSAAEELKAMTAAGKLSGIMITLLMPVTILLFSFLSNEYVSDLFYTSVGRLSLSIAVLLEILGVIWIYFILRLDY